MKTRSTPHIRCGTSRKQSQRAHKADCCSLLHPYD
ncbi:hypothetical protein CCACVL1_10331 [Corchorus capsularis]|uniref:Uncharacterized protein n=1 Tax=Corchorus capsularis TaxID=210143 RepID=A0A1R3IRP7_COCAP|nr:hypothetical protein CCACVL1_10331 [Corchorus capsularis]